MKFWRLKWNVLTNRALYDDGKKASMSDLQTVPDNISVTSNHLHAVNTCICSFLHSLKALGFDGGQSAFYEIEIVKGWSLSRGCHTYRVITPHRKQIIRKEMRSFSWLDVRHQGS